MTTALDPFIQVLTERETGNPPNRCLVTVLYEDTRARDRAISLSHRLVRDFWHEIDFGFSWWRFRYLDDATISGAALGAAVDADIIVFSYDASHELPVGVVDWLDRWTNTRSPAAGIIVPLVDPGAATELQSSSGLVCLQDAARRVGMDCLTPGQMRYPFSPLGSVEYIHDRANQTTRVLDDILKNMGHAPTPPTHWGINE